MIDVKQAASIAVGFVQDLYSEEEIYDILLEEVELSDDERYWYITVGFSRKRKQWYLPVGPSWAFWTSCWTNWPQGKWPNHTVYRCLVSLAC